MLASWLRSSRRLRLNSVSKHYHLYTIAPRNARSMRAEPRNLPKRCGVERHRTSRRPTEARTSAPRCMRPALGLKSLTPEARDRARSVSLEILPAARDSPPSRAVLGACRSCFRILRLLSNVGCDLCTDEGLTTRGKHAYNCNCTEPDAFGSGTTTY